MDPLPELVFTEKGEQLATSVATVTLYQVLLGRDPENSLVIEEAKTQSAGALLGSFLQSEEFADYVISPVKANTRLRHELTAPSPSQDQLDWITSLLVMPTARAEAVRAARSWKEFFEELLSATSTEAAMHHSAEPLKSDDALNAAPLVLVGENPPNHESILAAALDEISAIETRLERLKTLLGKAVASAIAAGD